ncbi:Beta-1 [Mactra antiquata]
MPGQQLCSRFMVLNAATATMVICFYYYTHGWMQINNISNRADITINQDIDVTINSGSDVFQKPTVVNRSVTQTNKVTQYKVSRQEFEYYRILKNTGTPVSLLHYYLTPRKEVVFPLNYRFMIAGHGVCKTKRVFLLIMCLSTAKNVKKRMAIRNTWGKVARNIPWPGESDPHRRVKIMFMFGTPESQTDQAILKREQVKYGDVVQADFVDSYRNLTIKVMMGIKWATIYCSGVQYMMKVDDDTFVHVGNLMKDLKRMQVPTGGLVIGHVHEQPPVQRTEKWAMNFTEFPFKYYPKYASGQTYVLSGNILEKLCNVGEHMPYIFIEDVFVTGILRTVINTQLVASIGYPHVFMPQVEPCTFQNNVRVAATNVETSHMYKIWNSLSSNNIKDCYKCLTLNC